MDPSDSEFVGGKGPGCLFGATLLFGFVVNIMGVVLVILSLISEFVIELELAKTNV